MSRPLSEPGWRGFHLFYHADRDLLLREVVHPLLAGLVADGLADRFYCVRYPLGGPHVRLRLETDGAEAQQASARVRTAAAQFFAQHPSAQPLPPERVRRENRGILATDSFATEADDVVFPDNTVVDFPVHVEVARYGGPGLYGYSLSFFTISTLEALRFVERRGAGGGAGLRMADAARLLVRQAWGHAVDEAEFVPLATYAVATMGARLSGVYPAADAAFERGREAICALVRSELVALAAPGEGPRLAEAARALSHEVGGAPGPERRMIATGQMHMTANRIGLLNGEEVYLARMLARSFEAVAEADPGFWRGIWEAHREGGEPARSLRDHLAEARAELAGAGAAVA